MTLYHYTDQNGFLGIFENQELWATKIQFLNDDNEYKLALKIADKLLKEKIENLDDSTLESRLSYYLKIIPSIKDMNLCVCSLTEQGDLLSQWRGYSNSLGGYSIGFNPFALEPFIWEQDCKLSKCIYDPVVHKNVIEEIIDGMISDYLDEPLLEPDDKEHDSYESGEVFLDRLGEIAPLIKDPNFAEEAEWRITSIVDFDQLEFRAGKSMLVPFFKLRLDSRKDNNFDQLIDEVIVGHTPHPDLAVSATDSFLWKCNLPYYKSGIKVKMSKIPFRNW